MRSESDRTPRNVLQFQTRAFVVTVRPSGTEPKLKFYCQLLPGAGETHASGTELLASIRTRAEEIAARIYNELLAHHPEHLQVLYRGFPLYVRKEQGEEGQKLGKVNERRIPVFGWQGGEMSAWLNIKLAEIAADVSDGGMSSEERAALDCLEEIAERPDVQLRFRQEPGDILFIHNMAVMHRRDRYEDHADPARRRLLYGMWTNLHQPRPVVPELAALRAGIPGPSPTIVGPN